MSRFIFPPWTNHLKVLIPTLALGGAVYLTVLVAFGASPEATDVGYQPVQPVPYSHALHAGELGIDCRYCHTSVEDSAKANLPPTQTCMNCHQRVRTESVKLVPVQESYADGTPVEWVRVHDLPDYVYFDHSVHVNQGVGCVDCHGRVDRMEEVWQHEPLSMSWCLDCHRDPGPHLRPADEVTNMTWEPMEDREALGEELIRLHNINPPEDCAACHR